MTSPSEARLQLPALRQKYVFVDRGRGLRGRPLNLTLAWNVMPRVGVLYTQSRTFAAGTLPAQYV